MRVAVSVVLSWVLFAGAGHMPVTAESSQQPRTARGRLFPPEKLGELEVRDRDEWQEPERIMDALGIADGARVADVGAGGGWFSVRLARRVGPNGRVYAEDIQKPMIESMERRIRREGLPNVIMVLGDEEDPKVPAPVDAALIVDTYPQFRDPVTMLRHVAAALLPKGRLGIVDFKKDGAGGPGPALDERVDPDVIRRDAEKAGLVLQRHETFLRYQYLLIFARKN